MTYFLRHHELYAWHGNIGMQVGDIIFVGPREWIITEDGAFSRINVNHTLFVIDVDANGTILEIAEGTGRTGTTVHKSYDKLLEAMELIGDEPACYARIDDQLAKVIAGMIDAQQFAGDGGWVTRGNENLRYY